jgi:hypothetical protein
MRNIKYTRQRPTVYVGTGILEAGRQTGRLREKLFWQVVTNNEELTDFALLKNSRWTEPLKIDASAEVLHSDMGSGRHHFVHCGLAWQAVCLHHAKYLFRIRGCCGRCIFLPSCDVPRSKVAPRPASRVPRNGSDAPRNAKIVPGSIFTPRKDPPFPRNAETVPGNIHVLGSWRDEHKLCGDGISNVARGWLGVEWAVDLN